MDKANTTIEVLAPAKINLFLHLTGKRNDGFHFLESLFVYCDFGDRLTITEAKEFGLELTGPFEPILAELCPNIEDNLILKAARKLANFASARGTGVCPVHIKLEKNIPVAAGVGGGSSDAAALLGGLVDYWELEISEVDLQTLALELGADVPASLTLGPKWVTGIGDVITPLDTLPSFYVVLVNPCVPLSTPSVFKTFSDADGSFDPAQFIQKDFKNIEKLLEFLSKTTNGLEGAAIELEPVVKDVLKVLSNHPKCRLARMSGSGPTCFGVFDNLEAADQAMNIIEANNSDWWVEVASVLGK